MKPCQISENAAQQFYGPALIMSSSPRGFDPWWPVLSHLWQSGSPGDTGSASMANEQKPQRGLWSLLEQIHIVGLGAEGLSLFAYFAQAEKLNILPKKIAVSFADFWQEWRPLLPELAPTESYRMKAFRELQLQMAQAPSDHLWWFLAPGEMPKQVQQLCLKLLEGPQAQQILWVHHRHVPPQSCFLPTILSRLRRIDIPNMEEHPTATSRIDEQDTNSLESQMKRVWQQKKGQWDYRYHAYFLDLLHGLGHHKDLSTRPVALTTFLQLQEGKMTK